MSDLITSLQKSSRCWWCNLPSKTVQILMKKMSTETQDQSETSTSFKASSLVLQEAKNVCYGFVFEICISFARILYLSGIATADELSGFIFRDKARISITINCCGSWAKRMKLDNLYVFPRKPSHSSGWLVLYDRNCYPCKESRGSKKLSCTLTSDV